MRSTQENLLALQRLGEQTAQLHRQFLDGQDRTLQVFQSLLEQQQRLLQIQISGTAPSAAPSNGHHPAPLAPPPIVMAPPRPVAPPALPVAPPVTAPVAWTPATTTPPVDTSRTVKVLLEVIAEKTGYPAEMLELDMELDADLGIDSIKRVEIFTALQERLPEAPPVKSEHLGTLRTLRQVAEFLGTGGASAVVQASCLPAADASPPPTLRPATPVLLEVIAEKTGYPAEMLELDMELDADLGIDSIKRVEIFTALQERLPEAPPVKSEHLGILRTLRQVAEFLAGGTTPQPSTPATRPSAPLPVPVLVPPPTEPTPTVQRGYWAAPCCWNLRVHRIAATACGRNLGDRRRHRPGREGRGAAEPAGLPSTAVAPCRVACGSGARGAGRTGAVSSFGITGRARTCGKSFSWFSAAVALRQTSREGNTLLASVARLDGAFGLSGRWQGDPLAGGLAGLTKTAQHEWPEVHCKALDVTADWDDAEEAALAIAGELLTVGPLEVGLSPQDCWTPRLQDLPLTGAGVTPLERGEVVVVTGGGAA